MRAFVLQFNLHRLEPNQTACRSLRSSASIFVVKRFYPDEIHDTILYSNLAIKYVLHVSAETPVIRKQFSKFSTVGNTISAEIISTFRLSFVSLVYWYIRIKMLQSRMVL